MNLHLRHLMVCSLVIAGTVATAGAQTGATGPIKLGVIVPSSGGAAFIGQGIVDGVKIAVEEINTAGGIGGRKLEYIVRDEQLKPDVAVAAAKELITSRGVDVLVGPATSGTALAVSEVAKQEKIVNFSTSSSAESLTGEKLHKYIFQLAATTDVQARNMIAILQKIGTKKLCYAGYDYAFTRDLFRNMRASMAKGIEETNEYLVPLTATDFNTLISQLAGDSCDTIVSTLYGGGFIAMAKQAEPFGLFTRKKMIAAGYNGDHVTAAALRSSYPEGIWTNSQDLWYYDKLPALNRFHEALAKVEGRKETAMYPIYGYVAIRILAEGIRKAGTTKADALAAALEGLTVESPLGTVTVDPKNHRVNLPAFYGPMVTVGGSDIKRMSPAELLR